MSIRSVFYLHSGNYRQWQRLNVSKYKQRDTQSGWNRREGCRVQAVVQLASLGALRSSAKPEEEGEERFIYVDLMAVSGLYACSSLSPSRGVSCLCRRTRAICAALTRQRGGTGKGQGMECKWRELPYLHLAILSAFKQRAQLPFPLSFSSTPLDRTCKLRNKIKQQKANY